MQNLKNMLVAACLLSASVGANAAVMPYSSEQDLGILAAGLNPFDNAVSGSFLDRINFSLAGESNGSFGLGALNFKVGGISILNINGLNLSLFDSDGMLIGYDDDQEIDFSVPGMHAGDYYLLVNGTANGISGGMYAGAINISPVPEANTMSMLLAGLAMLGLMSIRRRDH